MKRVQFVFALVMTGLLCHGQVMAQVRPVTDHGPEHESDRNPLIYYAPANLDEHHQEAMNTLISVRLDNVSLEDAIVAIASKAGFRVAFSRDALNIDWKQPVSVDYERATLLGALYRLLYDHEIHHINIAFSRYGQLILVPNHVNGRTPHHLVQVSLVNYGTVSGRVTDETTGEVMPGAHVVLEGTRLGAVADQDGRFVIRLIPEGSYAVTASYLGYRPYTAYLNVEGNSRVDYDLALKEDLIHGQNLQIIAHLRGQARAMTRQRESINIRSVISSEQIDRYTTMTVEDVLLRVTGMHGGSNIRGVGSAMSNTTVDGQRMGTTGTGSRDVDLSTLSVDMTRELEVIKVLTPDMDADALAGVININTRRPVGGARELDIRAGGGLIPAFYQQSGTGARVAASYGDSHGKEFSYAVNVSYQRSPSVGEGFETDWEIMNFGNGPVDVLSYLITGLQFDTRQRFGTGIQLTFQPSDRTSFHVQGMVNVQRRDDHRYGLSYRPRVETYINQHTTSREFGHDRGYITYDARTEDFRIDQYTFRASARHLFQDFDLEYRIGWGHGRFDRDRYRFRFESPREYEYFVTLDDRKSPTIDLINRPFPSQNLFDLNFVDNTWDEHRDNELSAAIDATIPHHQGYLKVGASNRLTKKKGAFEDFRMDYASRVTISQFDKYVNSDWDILGRKHHHTYHIPWMLNLNSARDFYYGQYPHMRLDRIRWAENSDTRNYRASEYTAAGYAMSNLVLGRITWLAGFRMEQTLNSYRGRAGLIDSSGRYRGSTVAENHTSYFRFFPNTQLVFGLGRMTNMRLAWSRSIGRPDFNQLSPYRLKNYDRETIVGGNPNLKPMISNNLDFLIEHYFMNVGEFTAGLFYKQLSDFVYPVEQRIQEGEFSGWHERSWLNGDRATVYGLELSWQQKLDFLPSFLSNLGSIVNYSWSRSVADLDRNSDRYGTFPLPGHHPHIVNAGLNFDMGGFSAGAFYSWSTPALVAYGNLRWVPEMQLQERVWFDRYRTGSNNLSITASYRLTSEVTLWADANNLFRTKTIDYFYDRTYYPHLIQYQHIPQVFMGIRFMI
ncbi:TonB-dependent receptor [Balneolales bacterium ANBcel1]|nr:TonB-dependent receptor [Balneolales bacterium ANBcel1]